MLFHTGAEIATVHPLVDQIRELVLFDVLDKLGKVM